MKNKYFAVSDVHGAKLTLDDFISKGFELDNPNHYIVFNGDNFDRGEYNKEIYELMNYLKEKIDDRAIFIKGNHEDLLLNYINDIIYLRKIKSRDIPDSAFILAGNGGKTTIRDLFDCGLLSQPEMDKLEEVKEFIESMKMEHRTDKYIFTHGGYYEGEANNWHAKYLYEGNDSFDETVIIGHLHLHHIDKDKNIEIKHNEKYDFTYAENKGIINIAGEQPNIAVFEE